MDDDNLSLRLVWLGIQLRQRRLFFRKQPKKRLPFRFVGSRRQQLAKVLDVELCDSSVHGAASP